MHMDESKVSRSVSKIAQGDARSPKVEHKASRKHESGQKVNFICSNVSSHVVNSHADSVGASYLETDETVPIFVLKYGDEVIPVHGNKADCHVEDLAYAFLDEGFVRGVVNHGRVQHPE